MRKFGILIATILFLPIIAGIYGSIHDQVTYTISPEYFTKFKYVQFGFEAGSFGGSRATVAVIGFLATWWTGLLIGITIGFTALIFTDHISMRKAVIKAICLIFIIAILFGCIGFLYGKFYLEKTDVDWWLPENLIDKNSFITVGSIHNFSYLGGLIGLFLAILYLLILKFRNRQSIQTN